MDEKQQQEIKDLNDQLDNPQPEESVETETQAETPTQNADDKFVEQDGEVYLAVDADDSQEGPDKGQPESETLSESRTQDDTNKDTPQERSREDLIEELRNADELIGRQGEELGDLRDSVDDDVSLMSEGELLENLSSNDLEAAIVEERTNLQTIDPYDSDEVNAQRDLVAQLETDLVTKKTEESLKSRFDAIDNEVLSLDMRNTLSDRGIELSDDEYDSVTENAGQYLDNGKLTEASFQKALIDSFGVKQVAKFYSMSGEQKARDDIKNASGKTYPKVDVSGSGKNSKLVSINKLSPRELNNALDNMSIDELNRLSERHNRK